MSERCPVCGAPIGPGDYRCDGEINGVRCGKDLTTLDASASRTEEGWA